MFTQTWYDDTPELREIVELTRTLCHLPEKAYSRSRGAEGYWSKVMKLWKTNLNVMGYNVVYAALHCIHWGVYPKDFPDDQDLLRLVELIKLEFLKVNADLECAKTKQFFNSALTRVRKSNSPHCGVKKLKSKTFDEFLESKTMYKLFGGEIKVRNLNLLTTTVHDFEDIREKAKRRFFYENIKAHIVKLIPEASTWTDDDFSNDANIVAQLHKYYGVDLRWCNQNFDQLIEVIELMDNDDFYGEALLGMTNIPMPLAKVLWSEKTEECIELAFCDTYEYIGKYVRFARAYGYHSGQLDPAHEKLQNSWLYCQIAEWYDNRSHKLSNKTRSCFLNASLGIF